MRSFKVSQPIELATMRDSDLTWLFHHVRAFVSKVQEANFTLLSSGQDQILKTDLVFSNHCERAMTLPVPLKDNGLQLVKSL